MNELALFAGAGGGLLASKSLGWTPVCAVEHDPYCATVLAQRQNDGLLPPFPIWCGDIYNFVGWPWRGIVDVVSGGFPCQNISAAGRGAGIDGPHSGLWREMARVIREVGPRYVFVENSPVLTSRGLGRVLGDLAEMGFDARWGVLGADDVGAQHIRKRIWIVADASSPRLAPRQSGTSGTPAPTRTTVESKRLGSEVADPDCPGPQDAQGQPTAARAHWSGEFDSAGWWDSEPDVGRVASGIPFRVDRLKALGNGQVPQCAAEAWRLLSS